MPDTNKLVDDLDRPLTYKAAADAIGVPYFKI